MSFREDGGSDVSVSEFNKERQTDRQTETGRDRDRDEKAATRAYLKCLGSQRSSSLKR